jgi:predicted dehydrogenase
MVVGAGAMGREHVRAALALGIEPERIEIVARGEERARALAAELGTRWRAGGVETLTEAPPAAVVAVAVPDLTATAAALVDLGCPFILLEKPGALSHSDLSGLAGYGAEIFLALNRRFYPSVGAARRLIEQDGGPLSACFDFTEIEEHVLAEGHPPEVLERWGVVNSVHVIDLFQHLAGAPRQLEARRSGSLPWHPAGATFSGSGETVRGALFAYVAMWAGAGRWSVEVTTAERKLLLRPLEELREQRTGGFDVVRIDVEEEPRDVKPGLYGQLGAFLERASGGSADPRLCSLGEASALLGHVETILGYS